MKIFVVFLVYKAKTLLKGTFETRSPDCVNHVQWKRHGNPFVSPSDKFYKDIRLII